LKNDRPPSTRLGYGTGLALFADEFSVGWKSRRGVLVQRICGERMFSGFRGAKRGFPWLDASASRPARIASAGNSK